MPILDRLQDPRSSAGSPTPSSTSSRPRSARRSSGPSRRPAATSARCLGVVEITLALHRLLESPRDRIVWDTGHQAYAHKLLTGRLERFHTLRQIDGDRRVPAPDASRRTTSSTAAMPAPGCRSPRAWRPPATCATRSSGSRSSSATRRCCRGLSPRGAQRHRPPPEPAPDRAQRQRDVDQPVGRGAVEVPVRDQALVRVAAEQVRLRPRRPSTSRSSGRAVLELSRRLRAVGRVVRPAGPAVRGPRHHLHRRDARARPGGCSRRPSGGRSRCRAR